MLIILASLYRKTKFAVFIKLTIIAKMGFFYIAYKILSAQFAVKD